MAKSFMDITKNGVMVLGFTLAIVYAMLALTFFGVIDLSTQLVGVLTISAALFLFVEVGGIAALGSGKAMVITQLVLAFFALAFGVLSLFGIEIAALSVVAGLVASIVVVLAVVNMFISNK